MKPPSSILVHQIVAGQIVHDAGDRKETDVFQALHGGVLGTHQAASSMAKPAAIHITKTPWTKNEMVLKT